MKQPNETIEPNSSAARFSQEKLRGVLLPFTTPFDEAGEVDACALRANILKWNGTGIKGYVALGSTGERVHLNERECLKVIDAARAVVPASLAFIVGVGQQSTRATIDEAQRAGRAGADAVLVITPHFYRAAMTGAALIKHYHAVADAAPVPVLLYNMPQSTNVAIAPETVARLSAHENIVGIKDSSADFVGLAETLRLVPDDFAVLTGNGVLLYAALAAGARGAILAVGCAATHLTIEIHRAVESGDYERARFLQQRLTPLARAVTTRYGIGGLKCALDALGYNGGPVRAPLEDAGDDARLEIKGLIAELAGEGLSDERRKVGATIA